MLPFIYLFVACYNFYSTQQQTMATFLSNDITKHRIFNAKC